MLTLNSVAILMDHQGHFDEAKSLYENALSSTERVLGVDHPDTKVAAFNLVHNLKSQVELLLKQNLFINAKPLAEKAFRIAERVLGEGDRDTLGSMIGLSTVLVGLNHLDEAKTFFERGVRISERSLGAADVLTIGFCMGLAGVNKRIEDYEARFPSCRLNAEQAEIVRAEFQRREDLARDV